MKVTIILLVLLMAAPCFARSKKSQARLDKRHAAVEAAAKANLMNAKADAITQRSRDSHKRNEQRLIYNQQIINQRAHQTAIRNGQQYRKQKAANSRKYTGF